MYDQLLEAFTALCRQVLGPRLTGVYLHGSMAMGCFHTGQSDIDLIVVVEDSMTTGQKIKLMEQILLLNVQAPAKGLEVSFVKREFCNPFVYPTPFELHASPVHLHWFQAAPADYVEKMRGNDRDLAAHFTIIHKYGIRLYGQDIDEVFGPVPKRDYVDSIWRDIRQADADICDDPLYVVLNLCRVLAYVRDGHILSKAQGWSRGLEHLPQEHHPLIRQALCCYQSGQEMQPDDNTAVGFAKTMLACIRQEARARGLLNNMENASN